jgi:hypothetical protein
MKKAPGSPSAQQRELARGPLNSFRTGTRDSPFSLTDIGPHLSARGHLLPLAGDHADDQVLSPTDYSPNWHLNPAISKPDEPI